MLIVDPIRSNISTDLLLSLFNATPGQSDFTNFTDVSRKMANVKFEVVGAVYERSKLENNPNVTGLLDTIQLFSPEWPAFVAAFLLIFSVGNIFIAVGPIFSKDLRKTRATILLSVLAVVDFLACLGAAMENIYYSGHPYYKPQTQRRCFFIRIPYHIFAFWGPVILLLIGLERITLLKYPLFYKFHIRKRILFTLALVSIVIPLSVLAISYVVVVRQDKYVPICYNRFATQLNRTDIATIYYAHVYALIALVYLIFGVMMMRRYRKMSRRRSSGVAHFEGKPNAGKDEISLSDGRSSNSSVKSISNGKLGSERLSIQERRPISNTEDNAKSLMKALMVITVIYVVAWVICMAALFASIGDTISTPKQLSLALYVSPLLYINHGCNFFVFGWTSKLYLTAYKKTVVKCWIFLKKIGKKISSIVKKIGIFRS